jgi:hypothetical protein
MTRSVDALALPNTDWLRHILVVTGSADEVTSFQAAAGGEGAIPWVSPDLDLLEEDQVMALVHPPDGSAGLSLAAFDAVPLTCTRCCRCRTASCILGRTTRPASPGFAPTGRGAGAAACAAEAGRRGPPAPALSPH